MRRPLSSAVTSLLLAMGLATATAAVDASHHSAAAQPSKTKAPKSAAGWLGVAMEPSKGKPGVLVTHVVRTSPADKAGVLAGDRIVKLDGAAVVSPGEVSAPVAAKGVGKTITLDVIRGAKAQSFTVLLGAKPQPDEIFKLEMLGRKIALGPMTLVSGAGPIAYPALDGRVVVIDVFATWCGPCAAMAPNLDALHAKYGPQGLTVLAISDEEVQTLSGWAAKAGVGYSIVSDPNDTAFRDWGAPALPSSLVVDKHGVVRDVEVGFEPGQVKRTEQLVQALLKEP
jgi:thiol-disulfide isomerase/thioredoxin